MGLDDDLAARIQTSLAGRAVTMDMLAALDELHVGRRAATRHLAAALALKPGMRVLDIGSGLGGAARYCAEEYGAHVTGIDLNPAYSAVATMLSVQTGLAEWTVFNTGNALDLPYGDAVFDAVYSLHTAMNIADKETLYRGVFRVLKPGGRFIFYDVLAGRGAEPLSYPLPWSTDGTDSFLIQPAALKTLLEESGFEVEGEDRTDFAQQALRRAIQTGKTGAIGVVHGEDGMRRITNLSMAIDDSCCELWQFSCLRRSSSAP